jgi:DeoR family transcriptional regulator, suf operon transcriptional repressor
LKLTSLLSFAGFKITKIMKSTRERILQTLLNHPTSTIINLAAAVGINAISVRHHLTSLQAEGLVTAEEERHGVGRPRLVYSLTEKGLEHFPTRYLRLTNRLLDQMKESLPPAAISRLFTSMAEEIASDYAQQVKSLSVEGKLDFIKDILAQEGFSVEWERQGNEYHIHEITCPYYHVGQSHPEVCTVDQTLISEVLSIPAQKINCVLSGDSHCTYVISDMTSTENSK